MSREARACQNDFSTLLFPSLTDRAEGSQCLSHSLHLFSCCPLPLVHPVEMANRAPALYRQSNQRPTSSKLTSTSCRLSWHVSPNVPASSSPRSTVYRSVTGQVRPQCSNCLHECFNVEAHWRQSWKEKTINVTGHAFWHHKLLVCVWLVEADSVRPSDRQRPGQHSSGQEAHWQDHRDHLCLLPRTADWRGRAATDY